MSIEQVKHLYYQDGLSTREIGEKLGKTVWQVISFMKKNNLKLRSSAETQKMQFYKTPLSFAKVSNLSGRKKLLHQAGLMLYWAEGSKAYPRTVDLANSDEQMILLFLKMLREIYRVDESRIRILLYCYGNQDAQKLIHYWSQKLSIRQSQFIKPYKRQDYDLNKINKMPHGLVHVRYNDIRLFMKIREEIAIIANTLSIG